PIFSNISKVRDWTAIARDSSVGRSRLSTIWHGTPWRANSHAIVSPTGPAPTIRTSIGLAKCVDIHQVATWLGPPFAGVGWSPAPAPVRRMRIDCNHYCPTRAVQTVGVAPQ